MGRTQAQGAGLRERAHRDLSDHGVGARRGTRRDTGALASAHDRRITRRRAANGCRRCGRRSRSVRNAGRAEGRSARLPERQDRHDYVSLATDTGRLRLWVREFRPHGRHRRSREARRYRLPGPLTRHGRASPRPRRLHALRRRASAHPGILDFRARRRSDRTAHAPGREGPRAADLQRDIRTERPLAERGW